MAKGVPGWHNGIFFNGDAVVEMNTFMDGTGSHSSLTVAGHHSVGLNTTMANADMTAIALRSGQTACFDGLAHCVSWKDGHLVYMNGKGIPVFTIDEEGNATFRGRVRDNVQ